MKTSNIREFVKTIGRQIETDPDIEIRDEYEDENPIEYKGYAVHCHESNMNDDSWSMHIFLYMNPVYITIVYSKCLEKRTLQFSGKYATTQKRFKLTPEEVEYLNLLIKNKLETDSEQEMLKLLFEKGNL